MQQHVNYYNSVITVLMTSIITVKVKIAKIKDRDNIEVIHYGD